MRIKPGTVIVNADDFGMSAQINRAIMTCFRQGLISSATIMVNMPGFEEACELALQNRLEHRIGIHINLTDGFPVLSELRKNPAFCNQNGRFRRFRPRYLNGRDRALLGQEVGAQIEKCRAAGLPLTHADSHQHVHTEPMVFFAIRGALRRHGISILRRSRNMDIQSPFSPKRAAKYCFNTGLQFFGFSGTDYFGTVDNFRRFRDADSTVDRSFEILTHPTFDANGMLFDHVDERPLKDILEETFDGMRLCPYPATQSSESQRYAA